MLTILTDFLRFAFFRRLKGDVAKNWRAYLALGFAITWLVGIGRTWDFDAAPLWLRTGLPSVAYTIVLAAIIWGITLALKPARWSYRNVLLMVAMTAAPGFIYAIPVERLMAAEAARNVNLIFLLIVASWRMALYYRFLRDVALLPHAETIVAWLLPPALILAPLSVFGLLDAIMREMGGVRDHANPGEIPSDAAALIALLTLVGLPILLIAFVVLALRRRRATATNIAE